MKNNPNATKNDYLNKASQMLTDRGVKGEYEFQDYRTRKPSGEGDIITGVGVAASGFIVFCSWIGKFLLWLCGSSFITAFFASIGMAVLGFFGFQAGDATAVGCGFLMCCLGICGLVGIFYSKTLECKL